MKQLIRYTAAVALLAAATLPATAQEFRTSYFMETSNFRHQMNPALLDSASAYVAMPFLGNVNVGATGNIGYGTFIFDNPLENNVRYPQTTFMNPGISAAEFLDGIKSKNRVDIYLNYNIFSTAFKGFKGMNVIELNVRSNSNVSLPYELFDFAKQAGAKEQYDLSGIGVRSQSYAELVLGHSHHIGKKWTVGGKMKFLFGLAYADLDVKNLDLTMNGDLWRVQGDASLKMNVLKSHWGHYSSLSNSADGRQRVDFDGFDVDGGLAGFGLAFDFGATYKVDEHLTVSASLTDLGFINWSNTSHASSLGDYTFTGFRKSNGQSDGNTNGNLDDIHVSGEEGKDLGKQFEDLGRDLEDMFNLYDDGTKSASSGLAATLNLGAEYRLPAYDKLKFGFLYTSRICGKYSYHQGQFSAAVRPVRAIEATLNFAATSTGVTCGGALSFSAKHYNFYIGTDRFFGKVSKQFIPINRANMNVNVGMTFPLR